MQAISNLFNDKVDRDLKRAQVRKMDAETQKVQAETLRINTETQNLALQNADVLIALSNKLTRDAEDAIALLETKKNESLQVNAELEERRKKLAPIMESMGLQPPQIELPSNVIPFPKTKE